MSIYDQETIFDGVFPKAPYNFDVPPPEYVLGPLKTIMAVVSARIADLLTDVASLQAQLSVQGATGVYLDAHGVLYSTPRLPGELDDPYRTRILLAMTLGKLTIPAIQHAVSAYVASITVAPARAPSVVVYDLQSDPATCRVDASNGNPIFIFQFVIELGYTIRADDVFFLNYSYLTNVPADPLTLFAPGTYYWTSSDSDLIGTVTTTKAGDTRPIYKYVVTITA